MAVIHGHVKHVHVDDDDVDERSPLLANGNGKGNGNAALPKDASVAALSNGTDEEVGNGTDQAVAATPLVEGMPEIAKKMHYLLPAIGIGIFLSAADQTIIVSSYGKIGSELKALNNTSWIATAYFLTITSFQPLYGKLSDIFGRKPCLLFAYLVFGLGCLFCGLARNIGELIAARAFAGIGGGGMTTVVSILMSDIIPLRKRGTWQGYINVIYATGAASGAPLGGIFADMIGWRWAFLGQAPMCLLAFAAVYFILDLPKKEEVHWRSKLAQVDFLGAFMLILAILSLLLGLDHGANVAWRNTLTLVCLGITFPLFAIFVFVETKIASNPFAPGHVILSRNLLPCYLCNFFAFGGYLSNLFYLPLFFQAVDSLSATQAGLRLIPAIIGGVSGSLSSGLFMEKTGKYYVLTICAYTMLFLGHISILLCTGTVINSTIAICISLFFCGFGGGVGVTTTLIALIANSNPEDQAIATACSYLFRSLGSVIGVSISATVVQQSLRTQLSERLESGDEADRIVEGVRQSLDFLKTLEPAVAVIVRKCYEKACQAAFGLTIAIAFGAAFNAWFIREKKLSR